MKYLIVFLFAAITFVACDSASVKVGASKEFNIDSVKTFLTNYNERFSSMMVSGDSATIAAMYPAEAVIMPPNMPAGKGGATMGMMSSMIKQMGATQFKVWATDVQGNEDMVIEEGKWEIRGNNFKDNGKFMVMWKNINGEWKVMKDIWNSDNPPQPAN